MYEKRGEKLYTVRESPRVYINFRSQLGRYYRENQFLAIYIDCVLSRCARWCGKIFAPAAAATEKVPRVLLAFGNVVVVVVIVGM